MLKILIKDYNDFKSIFGTRANGGHIINKILLSFWKYRYKIDKDYRAMQIRSLDDLYNLVIKQLTSGQNPLVRNWNCHNIYVAISRNTTISFKSVEYCGIERNGEAGISADNKLLILENVNTGKKLSIKPGKFIRMMIAESGAKLDESTITYVSELFAQKWEAYTANANYAELHIDDNFRKIYTQDELAGCFGSCMVNKNQYSFYSKCVKAKAAYLTDYEGKVLARCILYPEVTDGHGNSHSYAERQYSINQRYKQLLINKLIEAGAIDCYKSINAGCRDVNAIVDLQGNHLNDTDFRISCKIEEGDILSFMDTFKYYYPKRGIASNTYYAGTDPVYQIDHTSSHFRRDARRR